MSELYGVALTREELRRRTGRAEQLLGAELFERADGSERGVRCVRLRSGAIELEVVVDRALDLAQATVGGVPVAWISPTGLAAPGLAVPSGWEPFRSFFGGLLTTCGLEHTLGPTDDDATHFHYPGRPTHSFPLHGRVSATPGRLLGYGVDWERECVFCRGDVRQAHVFGESLTLEREIRIGLGGTTIELDDVVRNDGFAPTPHMLLYHVNLGWPLLGEQAEVVAGVGEPRCRDACRAGRRLARRRGAALPLRGAGLGAHAAAGRRRPGPRGDPEHRHRRWPSARSRAGLEPRDAPASLQWRVMSDQNYVVGLEPGNAPIEGRVRAREEGTLVILAPGEERRTSLRIALHNDANGLAAARKRIAACTDII